MEWRLGKEYKICRGINNMISIEVIGDRISSYVINHGADLLAVVYVCVYVTGSFKNLSKWGDIEHAISQGVTTFILR